jgi:hypothetical protein
MPNSASKVGHKQTVAYGRYKAANQAENRLADEIHTPITSEAGIGRRHHVPGPRHPLRFKGEY